MELVFVSAIFVCLQAVAYTAPAPLKPESPVWFPIPYYGISPPKYQGRVIFSNVYAGAFSCLGTEEPIYIIRKRTYCRDYYVCSKHNARNERHKNREYYEPLKIQCPEGAVFSTDTYKCEYNGRCEIPEYLLRPVPFLSEIPDGPRPEDYYVNHFYYITRDPAYFKTGVTPTHSEYFTPEPAGRPIPGGVLLSDIIEDILKILKIIPSHHQRSKRSAGDEDSQLELLLIESLSDDMVSCLPEIDSTTQSNTSELMSTTVPSTESAINTEKWGEEFARKIFEHFLEEKSDRDSIFALTEKAAQIISPIRVELLKQEYELSSGSRREIKINRSFLDRCIESLHKLVRENEQMINSTVSKMVKKYDGVFKVSREDYFLHSFLKDVLKDVESVIDVLSEAFPANVQRALKRVEVYTDKLEKLLERKFPRKMSQKQY